jgi:hypothetical protein
MLSSADSSVSAVFFSIRRLDALKMIEMAREM